MFGKKKPEPPQRPNRTRVSHKAETRAQLNLFGIPGIGGDLDNDLDVGDDDLEDELLALMGEGGGSQSRKSPSKPPVRQKINVQQQAAVDLFAISNYDVDINSGGEDDDDDIDEADLEAELGELTADQGFSRPQKMFDTVAPAPVPSPATNTMSGESMVSMLQERLSMYQKAKVKADASGETAKSRRFVRGIKTLEDLVKRAKSNKLIDESEIPPVVAPGETKPREAGNDVISDTVSALSSDFSNIQLQDPLPDLIPTFEPIPQVPRPAPRTFSPEPLINLETNEPPTVVDPPQIMGDPLVDERLKDYKKMAVILKRSGDPQGGLQYLKLVKALEAAIKSGVTVDLSAFPDPSTSEQVVHRVEPEEKPTPLPQQPPDSQPVAPEAESVALPNELFAGPEAPKTVLQALQQRLDKYKSEVEKATNDNNSSKARRMGRIVKQYEEAITLYKKGKPVDYDSLPTPPGFGPIPVPAGFGSSVPAGFGSSVPAGGPGGHQNPEASTLHPLQPIAAVSTTGPSPQPSPAAAADPNKLPTKPSSAAAAGGPSPPRTGSITRGGKPVLKLTLQEKQLNEIINRQKLFKEAALTAKKSGDVNQAKEFLRTAKGFDKLIEASKSGLPVDMNTLPSAPEAVAALEALDFDRVSEEVTFQPTSTSLAEVFPKLEGDLKQQLKFCMGTRQHYKTIGDVASSNRFEKMALETKRDLDTLRLAARQGDTVPKYRYETRTFSITECNADLTDNEIEIIIVQGINYKVANPADVDTFVKIELAYPSAEEAQVNKTSVIKDTNNPKYDANFKMSINRSTRSFQRFVHSKGVKLEVWSKGRFLRSSTLIGVATAKFQRLETKCDVHDAFEVLDGRKSVGKLEVKIRLRDPVLSKQMRMEQLHYLSITSV